MTNGIDIYHGNGWFTAKDFEPYDFIILQAHSGHRPADLESKHPQWFTKTAAEVAKAGKMLMTYLFLIPGRPVLDQAKEYLTQVKGSGTKHHWVDYEREFKGAQLPTVSQLSAVLTFLPSRTGVYSNGWDYPHGSLADWKAWWGAGYPKVANVKRPMQLHQYSNVPHDMNVVTDAAWWFNINALPAPTPPTQPTRTHMEYNPPLTFQPVVSSQTTSELGTLLLAADGSVYAFKEGSFHGSANGQSYFAGRTASHFADDPPMHYTIVATSGERYDY